MKLPDEKDVILHALDLLFPDFFDDPYVDKLGHDELIVCLNMIFKGTNHKDLWEKYKSVEDASHWSKEKIRIVEELKRQVFYEWKGERNV